MAFINDFIEAKDTHTSTYRPIFTRIKNYIFAALAFPLALNVGAIYWLLFFINRDLVVLKELQEFMPEWFVHMTRTNIVIFVLVEMAVTSRKYPRCIEALIGLKAVLIGYIVWTLVVYNKTGHWVMPIFEKFNWPQRIGFYGFNIIVPVTFYFVGEFLNELIWNRRRVKIKKHRRSLKVKTQPDLIQENIERSSEVRTSEV